MRDGCVDQHEQSERKEIGTRRDPFKKIEDFAKGARVGVDSKLSVRRFLGLLASQGNDWIDRRRTARGRIARDRRHETERRGSRNEHDRIVHVDVVQN